MTDFTQAMHDPSSAYEKPIDVTEDESLTTEQKIQILKEWEQDALALQRADEENMTRSTPTMLSRIRSALAIVEGS